MGKGYWKFIIGDEKKTSYLRKPHTKTNSSQQNLT
jgi:hypothetical protein